MIWFCSHKKKKKKSWKELLPAAFKKDQDAKDLLYEIQQLIDFYESSEDLKSSKTSIPSISPKSSDHTIPLINQLLKMTIRDFSKKESTGENPEEAEKRQKKHSNIHPATHPTTKNFVSNSKFLSAIRNASFGADPSSDRRRKVKKKLLSKEWEQLHLYNTDLPLLKDFFLNEELTIQERVVYTLAHNAYPGMFVSF